MRSMHPCACMHCSCAACTLLPTYLTFVATNLGFVLLAVANEHLTIGALSDLVGHIERIGLLDRASATILQSEA